jgi:hypothetical protein
MSYMYLTVKTQINTLTEFRYCRFLLITLLRPAG